MTSSSTAVSQNPRAPLRTAGDDIAKLVQHVNEARINDELPTFTAGLFRRGIDDGHGAEEHAALIKVLRQPAPSAGA